MQQQQQPKLNITLEKTTPMVCDECENQIFKEGVMLRKASNFITGTTQDAVIPIPVFSCSKCGHVNNEFLPAELQTAE